MCNPITCGYMSDPLKRQAVALLRSRGSSRRSSVPDMQRPSTFDADRNRYAGTVSRKPSGTSLA